MAKLLFGALCELRLYCGRIACLFPRKIIRLHRAVAGAVGFLIRSDACDFCYRLRYLAQGGAKVRKFDQRKYQAYDPEDMHVREERDQAQNSDDLELKLLALVRYSLR